jgi:hypothetical protein
MEMMGLAVIVILLALGMFFVARFALLKEKPSEAQTFQQSQIATSFVSTLLSSDAGCDTPASYTKLIEDMSEPQFSLLDCGPDGLVEHFNQSVYLILNRTLDIWDYSYQLAIRYPLAAKDSPGLLTFSKGCERPLQEETKTYYIPSDFGTITIQMKLCY